MHICTYKYVYIHTLPYIHICVHTFDITDIHNAQYLMYTYTCTRKLSTERYMMFYINSNKNNIMYIIIGIIPQLPCFAHGVFHNTRSLTRFFPLDRSFVWHRVGMASRHKQGIIRIRARVSIPIWDRRVAQLSVGRSVCTDFQMAAGRRLVLHERQQKYCFALEVVGRV